MAHRDGYTAFVSSGVGKRLATTLGLPQPVPLRRHVPGRPLVDGPVLAAGHADAPALTALRDGLTAYTPALGIAPLREAIAAIAIDSGVPVTRIGRVVTGADVTACDRNGDTWQPPRRGFEHFTG